MSPPSPLLAIAAIYVASEMLLFVVNPSLSGAVRLGIYSFLLYFVVQGSRSAAYLWAALSAFGALHVGVSALEALHARPFSAALLMAYAAFFLASAGYVLLSRRIRNYQSSQQRTI